MYKLSNKPKTTKGNKMNNKYNFDNIKPSTRISITLKQFNRLCDIARPMASHTADAEQVINSMTQAQQDKAQAAYEMVADCCDWDYDVFQPLARANIENFNY